MDINEEICVKNIKSWFDGLSSVGRVSLLASIVLGGLFTVSAMSPLQTTSPTTQVENIQAEQVEPVKPVVTTKTETKTEAISFDKNVVESSDLAKGVTQIQTYGVEGVKTITYDITMTDGVETSRTSTEAITTPAVDEVTLIGTYVKPVSNCDSNYSGCVPIASDVDCAGGSGNGPAYTSGPVQVIGTDIYGLDRDNDGWGCE